MLIRNYFFFSECLPAKCGRAVIDGLVSDNQAHALLKLAKKGLAKGGSNGGASIIDLHSGALSSGEHFVNLFKTYPDLFQPEDFSVYRQVKETIKAYIAEHFEIGNYQPHFPKFLIDGATMKFVLSFKVV